MVKKVLLVEDEEKLINNLADKLRAEGYDVYTAMDGETGWNLARSDTFDLIVLDIMLIIKYTLGLWRPRPERHGRCLVTCVGTPTN